IAAARRTSIGAVSTAGVGTETPAASSIRKPPGTRATQSPDPIQRSGSTLTSRAIHFPSALPPRGSPVVRTMIPIGYKTQQMGEDPMIARGLLEGAAAGSVPTVGSWIGGAMDVPSPEAPLIDVLDPATGRVIARIVD